MTYFPFKSAALAAMLLLGVPIGAITVLAQTVADQEFVRNGDFFPEVSFPMSSVEKQLFVDIQEMLERIQSGGPSSRYFMPNATKSSLLSVHLRVRFETHVARARRRTRMMTEAA